MDRKEEIKQAIKVADAVDKIKKILETFDPRDKIFILNALRLSQDIEAIKTHILLEKMPKEMLEQMASEIKKAGKHDM